MPLTRKQIYRRRRITVFGSLGMLLSLGFYLPMTLLAPLDPVAPQVMPYSAPAASAAALEFPGYGASGIGAVGFPGLLAKAGTEEALPIASITKVVTALVVLDSRPLAVGEEGPTIEFTSADVAIRNDFLAINGQVSPVRAGMSLSQRDVLEVVLISSANNYAESLARWAFGSQAEYLAAAADWLAAHELASTTIADTSGMSPQNTSTPADLVEIGKLALAHPVVSEVIAKQSTSVPDLGEIRNTNQLLGTDGVDGIKTGTLRAAGACLLFSADYQVGSETVTVVGVILGADDHPQLRSHVRALLASVVSGFREVTLATEGDSFAGYTTPWGESVDAVAAEDASVLVWSDTPVTALVEAEPLALGERGSAIGSVTFVAGERTVSVPLQLSDNVDDPGPWWRLTNPTELF